MEERIFCPAVRKSLHKVLGLLLGAALLALGAFPQGKQPQKGVNKEMHFQKDSNNPAEIR